MIFAGIDGGGTSTKYILINEQGRVVASGKTGPANYHVVGLKAAVQEINRAVVLGVEQAGGGEIELLGLGIAGLGRSSDIQKIKEVLNPPGVKEYYLTDDGVIALYGAHAARPGIVAVAGTGSVVYGMGDNQIIEKAGGWGPVLGDEGSGYWIGLQALKSIIKYTEREVETSLTARVLGELELKKVEDLVSYIHQPRSPRVEVAGLAPIVLEEMKNGDKLAEKIILQGLDWLADDVKTVYRKLGGKYKQTAVMGGLFLEDFIYDLFRDRLQEICDIELRRPLFDPRYGAILYALQKADKRSVGREILDNLL